VVGQSKDYIVSLTDTNGCISYDTLSITVNSLPNVFAGIDTAICVGDSLALIGSGATIYNWTHATDVVFDSIQFSPIATGLYYFEGIDINGCINYDTVGVLVNNLPAINAGLDQTICLTDSVLLSASGAISYVWSQSVIDSVYFSPDSTGSYTVIGTDNNGCHNADSLTVFVNTLPIVDAGLDTSICIYDSIALAGLGAATYTWSSDVIDGELFLPDSTALYTVIGTDSNGCIATDSVSIGVMAPYIDAGLDQELCYGDSVVLIGLGEQASWSSGVIDSISFVPDSTMDYVLTVQDSTGCYNYDTVRVVVNELPTVIAGDDTVVCALDDIILTGSGASVYTWDMGVVDGVLFVPDSSRLYALVGTDSNGCINVDTILVEVSPLPTITSVDIIDVEYGDDGAIFVEVEGLSPFTYDWDNDGLGDLDDESNIYYLSSGEYQLMAYDSLGCEVDTLVEVANTAQLYVSEAITPNGDGFNDRWAILGLYQYPEAHIRVFNAQGIIVYENNLQDNNGYYQYWDAKSETGDPLPPSDYYWVIDLVNPAQMLSGSLTITYW
jgi:gliding motility-associated-like protein